MGREDDSLATRFQLRTDCTGATGLSLCSFSLELQLHPSHTVKRDYVVDFFLTFICKQLELLVAI